MSVAVAIQHHPERAELLPPLLDALAPAYVAADPLPDDKRRSAIRSYVAALRAFPEDASHLAVIQDDALPCRNLRAVLELVAISQPTALVLLFVPGNPPEMAHAMRCALDRGDRYSVVPCRRWVPAVALLWPKALAEDFLTWQLAQRWPPSFGADDEGIGRWQREREVELVATIPSVVEHPDEVPSIVGRRVRGGRRAASFIGVEDDPLELGWT